MTAQFDPDYFPRVPRREKGTHASRVRPAPPQSRELSQVPCANGFDRTQRVILRVITSPCMKERLFNVLIWVPEAFPREPRLPTTKHNQQVTALKHPHLLNFSLPLLSSPFVVIDSDRSYRPSSRPRPLFRLLKPPSIELSTPVPIPESVNPPSFSLLATGSSST
jgi:hypothetical protein